MLARSQSTVSAFDRAALIADRELVVRSCSARRRARSATSSAASTPRSDGGRRRELGAVWRLRGVRPRRRDALREPAPAPERRLRRADPRPRADRPPEPPARPAGPRARGRRADRAARLLPARRRPRRDRAGRRGRDPRRRADRADALRVRRRRRGPAVRRRRPRGAPRARAASSAPARPTSEADVVIEAAGTEQAWRDAVELVRPGGTVVFFGGLPARHRRAGRQLPPALRGAHAARRLPPHAATVRAALAFLASGARPWERLITHRVGWRALPRCSPTRRGTI